ncbi:unnamed protein product [Caenorhabditis angaria]|uniref:GEX Interacting protein n=1 Tax=Caenorhabditis angaria TaxID=860376 RepID=A0A9P1IGB4_9PELO|nr:unnamed protein product [Caenorhabditis angaria]
MNQNLSYTYNSDPRGNNGGQNQQIQGLSFHPSSYQTSTYTNSTTAPFHSSSSAAFIPNNVTLQQTPQRRMGEEKNLVNMLDAYFIDSTTPSTSTSWNTQQPVQVNMSQQQLQQTVSQYQTQLVPQIKSLDSVNVKLSSSPDKSEKERAKKARQAEAARMRYHRLSNEEKRELNLKRTLAQKRKRQREKEMEELESILRETNDIQEDPDITEQLREKRMRAKWAEAARTRYARMTPEERRAHNTRRRMRQMQNAMSAIKSQSSHLQASGMATGDPMKDDEAVRQHIKSQNAKKAEAARQRYHRMTDEEKRIYNQRRTEAFRRRRMEEEMLLAMPIGRINGEALDRAQQIVVRNAKRAEAARLRYQRMTPDQRKAANSSHSNKQHSNIVVKEEQWMNDASAAELLLYASNQGGGQSMHDGRIGEEEEDEDHLGDSYNQKRYTPKRRRNELEDMMNAGQMAVGSSGTIGLGTGITTKKEDLDALTSLERDVMKRTQQAQQVLMRQQRANQENLFQDGTRSVSPPPQQQTYIMQQSNGGQQGGQAQQVQLNLSGAAGSSNGINHQVHTVHQLQPQQLQSHQQYSNGMIMSNQNNGRVVQQQQQQQNQQSQSVPTTVQQTQIMDPYRA